MRLWHVGGHVAAVIAMAACGELPFVSAQDAPFSGATYLRIQRLSDPRISPDGRSVLFTRATADTIANRWADTVWAIHSDGSDPRALGAGHRAAWSPDGEYVAYLDGAHGSAQIMVRRIQPGAPVATLTSGSESVRAFRWSPNGRQIAFTMLVRDSNGASVGDRRVSVISPLRAKVAGSIQLFVVDVSGALMRQVTSGSTIVGALDPGVPDHIPFDWLDANTLVFDGDSDAGADARYLTSQLHAIDIATSTVRRITTRLGLWHSPVVSPDGRWIAFTGLPKSPDSYRAQDLYVIRPDGTAMKLLTTGLERDPLDVQWASNVDLWFVAQDRGAVNTFSASTKAARARAGSNGAHRVLLGGVSPRGGFGVVVRSSGDHPDEIHRFPLRRPWELAQLTLVNDSALADVTLGEVEELDLRGADGTPVQGWLHKPPGFSVTRRYPLVFEIHGGPHAMFDAGFDPLVHQLAGRGSLVLRINPRGSTGYGNDFGNRLGSAYPGADAEDLLAALDQVIHTEWVDTTQIYVTGCGGGGMVTSALIARSTRFAAATMRCGADWVAFAAPTAVNDAVFARPMRVDPVAWLEQSPLRAVGSMGTRLLLIAGTETPASPVAIGATLGTALALRGVATMSVRVPGEAWGTTSTPLGWLRTVDALAWWFGPYRR